MKAVEIRNWKKKLHKYIVGAGIENKLHSVENVLSNIL